MSAMGLHRPLDGIRVLDLTRLLPGPFATMLLGDMGAEIIKVEATRGGDYARYYQPFIGSMGALFASVNRNKRSLALDLKQPRGVEALRRLLETSDVLIESFRPGVLARLGLDPEELRQTYPRLVICSLSGWGQSGSMNQVAGHDINYMARAGLLTSTGTADGTLAVPGFQLADLAGGALYSCAAVLAALVGRGRTGQGAWVDISMTDGALSFLLPALSMLGAGGPAGGASRELLNGGVPCYGLYKTSDERYMALGALEPKFWMVFCRAVGLEEHSSDGVMSAEKGEEVQRKLRALFVQKTQAEWTQLLCDVDCCCVPVQSPQEVANDPLFVERGLFFSIEGQKGQSFAQTATPLTDAVRDSFLPPPLHGEHTRSILMEAGYEEGEIENLLAAGVALQAKL